MDMRLHAVRTRLVFLLNRDSEPRIEKSMVDEWEMPWLQSSIVWTATIGLFWGWWNTGWASTQRQDKDVKRLMGKCYTRM
jgi:hypothetical protein